MRRFLAGVCCGALAVGLTALVVGQALLEEKCEFGRHMGRLDGQQEAMEAIRAEFGEASSSEAGDAVFALKTSTAVATMVDGVKTIRVVR